MIYDQTRNRVTGVEYLDANGAAHRVERRVVVLAAHAIETPRLLLLSANGALSRRSRELERPGGPALHEPSDVAGVRHVRRADQRLQGHADGARDGAGLLRAPMPTRRYRRGFVLLSYMMTPVTYAKLSGSFFGAELKDFLYDYPYTAAWWAHAEGLPDADNTVTLDPG